MSVCTVAADDLDPDAEQCRTVARQARPRAILILLRDVFASFACEQDWQADAVPGAGVPHRQTGRVGAELWLSRRLTVAPIAGAACIAKCRPGP